MTLLPQIAGAFSSDQVHALMRLRQDLHRHPELSWREHTTASRVEDELRRLGLTDIQRVAGTGIIARISGRQRDKPIVAIRGDMDALPIHEATSLPYTSEVSGVMHACGHDVHTTWT